MRLISTCLGILVVVALLNGVMTAPPVAADTSTATLEASADETAVPAPARGNGRLRGLYTKKACRR